MHGSICAASCVLSWRLQQPPAAIRRILKQEAAAGLVPVENAPPARAARWARWLEFTRWKFWLPLAIVAGILLAGGSSWERIGWLTLRFVAVGLVLMAFVSLLRPARWSEQLRRLGWWGPALAFNDAFSRREKIPPASPGTP